MFWGNSGKTVLFCGIHFTRQEFKNISSHSYLDSSAELFHMEHIWLTDSRPVATTGSVTRLGSDSSEP